MPLSTRAIDATFAVPFRHRVRFTTDALDPANTTLADVLRDAAAAGPVRVLAFVDTGVARAMPDLPARLRHYAAAHADVLTLVDRVQPVVGGELCKNDRDAMYRVLNAIHDAKIDRQAFVLAIGGGAVLDCVGFAAAVAHRGVRLIRMPTTTLSQDDSGVGVKNGINGFGQKNFLGSFAVPWAVVNDRAFLTTLSDCDWRAGFSEAVKVACIRDAGFFEQIEQDADRIAARDVDAAWPIIQRSAMLHLEHITTGGDPFELAAARPLDFGHWAAHRLEAMTDFRLSHGEAVSIGIALDVTYAAHVGLLDDREASRILALLRTLNLPTHDAMLANADAVLEGLDHFREHLGGRLTITLLRHIGEPVDVHTINRTAMHQAMRQLLEALEDGRENGA